jgi:hypothetical protein
MSDNFSNAFEGENDVQESDNLSNAFEDENDVQASDNLSNVLEDENNVQTSDNLSNTFENENDVQESDNLSNALEDENDVQASDNLSNALEDENDVQASDNLSNTFENENDVQESDNLSNAVEDENDVQASDNLSNAVEDENDVQASDNLSNTLEVENDVQALDNLSTTSQVKNDVKSSDSLLTAFEVENDVKAIRNATRGAGTDFQVLIDILGGRTPQQMVQIINGYKKAYEISLIDSLNKELILGNFGYLCSALAIPILEYDVICLHEALYRLIGANDSVLIEILVGRTEKDISIIKAGYYAKYTKELEEDIKEHIHGDLKTLFLAILAKKEHNEEFNCEEDVEVLYQAGEGKRWGHKKVDFIKILTQRTDKQLNKIFYEYEKKYEKPFLSVIRNKFHGHFQVALANIAKSAMNRIQLIAELFENAVYGIDTKHTKLIRLVVRHRYPPLMKLIKEAYLNLYGITLEERITSELEIFGMYKDLIMKIIGD